MKFIIIPFSIFFICLQPLCGQSASVQGQVVSNGTTVPFANVAVEGTGLGISADLDGHFLLENIPAGEQTLVISAVGYRTWQSAFSFAEGEKKEMGQVEIAEDVLGLEKVVVTGTMKRTYLKDSPIKVEVVTGKFLMENRSPANLVESIAMINGVEEVVECGVCGTNSLRINGLEGPYTAVLMDGAPMFGNLASVYGLNGIPASLIERIEVIKGPSSTLYGSEAVAGVINVITKQPERQPLFSADMRSTTHKEVYGNMGFAPSIGKWDAFVGLDYAYVNDFHDEVADGFGDVTGTDRVSLFSKWSLNRESGKPFFVAAKYLYEDRHNGVFDYLKNRAYKEIRGSSEVYGESIFTNRFELFGTYQLPFEEKIKLDFSFNHHDQDSYYGSDYYVAKQQIGYANLLWDKDLDNNSFVVGVTYRFQYYDDNTAATLSENGNLPSRQSMPGLFAQNEWKPSAHFSILTGARLDHYAKHGPIFAPRLNVKFKPGNWSTLRLNVGTGFRIVNLFTEDHAFVTGQRTVEIVEALSPERSWNASLNFNQVHSLFGGQGTFDIDAFYTHFNNKIIPDYDTPGKIVYANSDGYAVSRGLGLSLNQSFMSPLSFSLGMTLQDVTQTEMDAEGIAIKSDVEFAPTFSGTGTLNYRWRKMGLLAAWSFNLTGPMQLPEVFDLDENGQPQPVPRPTRSKTWSRHTLQLTKTFKEKNLELYGGVENLFNHRQSISPLTGITDPNAPAGFSDHFDTVYSYAPLSGREVFLGVRWRME